MVNQQLHDNTLIAEQQQVSVPSLALTIMILVRVVLHVEQRVHERAQSAAHLSLLLAPEATIRHNNVHCILLQELH